MTKTPSRRHATPSTVLVRERRLDASWSFGLSCVSRAHEIGTLSRKESGMSHRDSKSKTAGLNANGLKLDLRSLLGRIDESSVALRRDCTWSPSLLAAATLMWAWRDETTLRGRFFSPATNTPLEPDARGMDCSDVRRQRSWTGFSVSLSRVQPALGCVAQPAFPQLMPVFGRGICGSRVKNQTQSEC
jgi:hypothetical protein